MNHNPFQKRCNAPRGSLILLTALVAVVMTAPEYSHALEQVTIAGGRPDQAGLRNRYSLAIQPGNGEPAVASMKASGKGIQLATFNGSSWNYESVMDSTVSIGWMSLAFDPLSGEPRVAYTLSDWAHPGARVALRSGGTWTTEIFATTQPIPTAIQLVISTTGALGVAFVTSESQMSSNPRVYFADRTGPNTYSVQQVEGSSTAAVGEILAATVNPDTGEFGLAYKYNPFLVNSEMHWAHKMPGGGWAIETVGAPGRPHRCGITYALRGSERVPHVAIYDLANVLFVRTRVGGSWIEESLGSPIDFSGIAADPQSGRAAVLYADWNNIFLTRFNGSTWVPQTVSPRDDASPSCRALAFSSTGVVTATVFYELDNTFQIGALAAFRDPSGSLSKSWVLDWRAPGQYPSVAIGPGPTNLWVAYQEGAYGHARLAHTSNGEFVEQTIDSTRHSGYPNSLVWPDGSAKPWLVYGRLETSILAVPTDSGYTLETISTSGGYPVAAYDAVHSQICVALRTDSALRFARRTGPSAWNVEDVPIVPPLAVGRELALALDPTSGTPTILYVPSTDGYETRMDMATYDGANWSVETFATAPSSYSVGRPQLLTNPNDGHLWASYLSSIPTGLFVTVRESDGSAWLAPESIPVPAGTGSVIHRLILDPLSGTPRILLGRRSGTPGNLYLIRKVSASWTTEVLSSSVALDFNRDNLGGAMNFDGTACFVAYDSASQRLLGWMDSRLLLLSADPKWNLYR